MDEELPEYKRKNRKVNILREKNIEKYIEQKLKKKKKSEKVVDSLFQASMDHLITQISPYRFSISRKVSTYQLIIYSCIHAVSLSLEINLFLFSIEIDSSNLTVIK